MTESPLIELQELTKDYGSYRALNRISLSIGKGVTGLLGPNGAGKSTLIKVLLGLLKTTSGQGSLLGYQIGRENRDIRAAVGYMPEDDCFLYGLTGIEAVQFSAQLSRFPATEGLRRAHEILDFCGLAQERYRLVEGYSTGMRQKLRFAQAIVHDPPLLILDEPTSGLDPEERQIMLNRIRLLSNEHGKTIILCTHILPDVQAVCDHVVILAAGAVRVSDRIEVLSKPASPAVHVRVASESTSFVAALEADGMQVDAASNGVLTVAGELDVTAARIWQVAFESKTVVRSLTQTRNSLEQIFLNAVQEVQVENASS